MFLETYSKALIFAKRAEETSNVDSDQGDQQEKVAQQRKRPKRFEEYLEETKGSSAGIVTYILYK